MKLISLFEAIGWGLEEVKPIEPVEFWSIMSGESGKGRFLAKEVIARRNSPPFSNGAMDGYIASTAGKCRLKGRILAGNRVNGINIEKGECYYIATGAPIPSGGNFIAPWEKVEVEGEWVTIPPLKKGANIRKIGEEFQKGEILIPAGEELTPATILTLAGQGITVVPVRQKLRIALIPTGSELVEPFQAIKPFQIYNSNGYGIASLFRRQGWDVTLFPPLSDDLNRIVQILGEAIDRFDGVITIGGASGGEADFLRKGVEQLGGEWIFQGINLKPGKPTLLGIVKETPLLILPGNLLSSYLNSWLIGIPLFRKLAGARKVLPLHLIGELGAPFKANPSKEHLVLGNWDGEKFYPYGGYKYGSGMVTPLLHSNGVAVLPAGKGGGKIGDRLLIIPFDSPFVPIGESFLVRYSIE